MEFFTRYKTWVVSFVLALFVYILYALTLAPPGNFPSGEIIVIPRGASVAQIVSELSAAHLVAHPALLHFLLRVSGTATSVQAGTYRFDTPENVIMIAYRLSTGGYGIPPVRITFVEGITVRESAQLIADTLPGIAAADFIKTATPYEGYLFPDTYIFPPGSDVDSIVASMRANFNEKTKSLLNDIQASDRSLSDIVIMASLVEKEARTSAVKRIVAGILWNRLKLGMPLQVDAVFGYIFHRETYSPSFADLKVDSPYNTYTHAGLPPGPIGNPGLDSLEAILHPTKTNYLYYLVDKKGDIHYATTYATHQANQNKYLH